VATLLPVAADGDCSELEPGIADAVYAAAVPPPQPAPPPRLGVQLGAKDGTVQVEAVTPGSLAERSGLKRGDRIVALAGSPVQGVRPVIEAVRAQPPGTWLPMQIRRGDATIDVVVRFPPR
jgi:S1-C subfamily serine protease